MARERDRLAAELRRIPTIREVADSLGIEVEEAIAANAALTGLDALSLDAPPTDAAYDGETTGDRLGAPEPGYELVEDIHAIAPALARLPKRARLVLRLRFLEDMTQLEIGQRLGVSQMHVSRVLRRSLGELRRTTSAGTV